MADAANVRNWAGATVLVAPRDSVLPTDLVTPWDDAWNEIGLLDEDSGIEAAITRSATKHYAYGRGLVRTTTSKNDALITFTALEDNPVVFDLRSPGGAGTTDTGVTTRAWNNYTPNPLAFGIELTDGPVTRRLIIPQGEVVEPPATMKLTDDSVAMFSCAISCYVFTANQWAIEITNDPAAVVS